MKTRAFASPGRHQRGASLIVGLIMLVLITLVVLSGFLVSTSNLKAAGNMQLRNEGVAAANQAIELVIGSAFTTAPVAQTINVDINKDDKVDYVVAVAKPDCIRALKASSPAPSDVELPTDLTSGATWNTDWEIFATVTDASSGTSVRIREGVRILLPAAQKNTVCP